MSILLNTLHQTAISCPEQIALQGEQEVLTYRQLDQAVTEAAQSLNAQEFRALGLLADNGISWALADLSALAANIPLVPLPLFFSPQQMLHIVNDVGLDGLLTDQPQLVATLLRDANLQFHTVSELCGLYLIRLLGIAPRQLPPGTAKITYTSGTTGEPKGVCLSLAQIETVAVSLREGSQAQSTDNHLCLTPLSTLLENIGGIYTPLLAGACTYLLPLQQVGLKGVTRLDVARMLQALHDCAASSAILAPQMLQALVAAGEGGASMPTSLRFVAVGGAPVSQNLLQRAWHLKIPVFEGYGLSECASVVALNTPDGNLPGSVGRPLPHVSISFSDEGEILVSGSTFLGYLGQGNPAQPWPTGDLGYLGVDGFLYLTGRRKSVFITSFGRNIAPEWVERELMLHPAIAQVAVFGEAQPFNVAVVVPRPGFEQADINAAVQLANRVLPDYARVQLWAPASAPFTVANGQITANGRLKREVILAEYTNAIEALYEEEKHDVF